VEGGLGLLVEVSMGVDIEGEEVTFETVYCGSSVRFVQVSVLLLLCW
jgi:hypothetical protein